MAIKCPKCDSINTHSARFCSSCAAPLDASKEIPVTETIEAPMANDPQYALAYSGIAD